MELAQFYVLKCWLVINMNNPYPFSNTNKRYYTYDYYLKQKYGSKVFKVAIDGGFTCPNRDGKVSIGGCHFCSSLGSGEFGGNRKDSLFKQFDQVRDMLHRKWPIAKYIVYFQSFSNTYAPVSYLKSVYEPLLSKENVVGLSIATRPDCFNEEIYEYLSELAQKTDLTIELGLQTIHDDIASSFNRGYNFSTFLETFNRLKELKINTLVHLINGLVNESKEMMLENARVVGKLKPWGIKFHSLYVIKNTMYAKLYEKEPFKIMEQDEYIDLVVRQLELLPKDCVIERLTGDPSKEDLIAPNWALKKVAVLNGIDKKMARENTYQGRLFNE